MSLPDQHGLRRGGARMANSDWSYLWRIYFSQKNVILEILGGPVKISRIGFVMTWRLVLVPGDSRPIMEVLAPLGGAAGWWTVYLLLTSFWRTAASPKNTIWTACWQPSTLLQNSRAHECLQQFPTDFLSSFWSEVFLDTSIDRILGAVSGNPGELAAVGFFSGN